MVGDFVFLGVCRFAIELGHRPALGAIGMSVRFRHGVCGSDRRVFGGIGPLGGFLFEHIEQTKPMLEILGKAADIYLVRNTVAT